MASQWSDLGSTEMEQDKQYKATTASMADQMFVRGQRPLARDAAVEAGEQGTAGLL